jgi:hypothetical protein
MNGFRLVSLVMYHIKAMEAMYSITFYLERLKGNCLEGFIGRVTYTLSMMGRDSLVLYRTHFT